MKIKKGIILFCIVMFTLFISFSCAHSRPAKPGPNFRWVQPVTTASGDIIPGHWIHVGPVKPGRVWVPTHLNVNGGVVPGYWRHIKPSKKNRVWVRGHHGPRGRWIPGHLK